MVSRGRRSSNRFHYEEEKNDDEEEINPQNTVTAEERTRIHHAQSLAQEALRLATEAREAAMRLKEYRATIALPYRQGNMVGVDDTSTLRDSSDDFRS